MPNLLLRALPACLALTALTALSAGADEFHLGSPDFVPGGALPQRSSYHGMGCSGANLSPALQWDAAPAGTRSFALMVHDPDAATGGAGIWHWVIIDIPPTARALGEGAGTPVGSALPPGSQQIRTDYETAAWGGPCPPPGQASHHYVFTLYALDTPRLDLPAGATASHAGFLINRHALGKAVISATYGR